MRLAVLLYGIPLALRLTALLYPTFRARLKQRDLIAQLKLQDNSTGRFIEIKNGRIHSKAAIHPKPDVTLFFKSERVALNVLMPPQDYGELVHAGKNFQMGALGKDELVCWWMQTLNMMLGAGWKFGVDAGNGETRYVNNTNGGPVYVYVGRSKREAVNSRHRVVPRLRLTPWRGSR
jgi:trimethylamine-N-oxide reductase (cytochrome c)